MTANQRFIKSPQGMIFLQWVGAYPTITWHEPDGSPESASGISHPTLDDLGDRIRRYLKGEPVDFSDIPTPDGTDFQRRCWDACRAIPRGETVSYGTLAGQVGSPGASRAVGQTMRRNPLPIIVPCHRVVASTGRLHGYAGGIDPDGKDLARKRFLLAIEGACEPSRSPSLFE